MKSTVMPRD